MIAIRVARVAAGVLLCCAVSGPASGQFDPCPEGDCGWYGKWSAPFNIWQMLAGATDYDGTCRPGTNPRDELGHSTLVSNHPAASNDKVGSLLIWRFVADRPQPTYLWRPGTATVYTYLLTPGPTWCGPGIGGNLFCGGHSYLGDGRLVGAGGGDPYGCLPPLPTDAVFGSREAWLFDPSLLPAFGPGGTPWADLPCLIYGTWYPGALTVADGDVVIGGGVRDGCTGLNNGTPLWSDFLQRLDASNPFGGWVALPGLPGEEMRLYPHFRLLSPDPPTNNRDLALVMHQDSVQHNQGYITSGGTMGTPPLCNVAWLASSAVGGPGPTALPNPPEEFPGQYPGISTGRRVEGNSVPLPWAVDQFGLIGGNRAGTAQPCVPCPREGPRPAPSTGPPVRSPQAWRLSTSSRLSRRRRILSGRSSRRSLRFRVACSATP
ncbi:MAG: hypothetical protein L0323_19210 [Planctomycetes bacterium]|nr:hypothetical protein [Planctomycetota bacterium]